MNEAYKLLEVQKVRFQTVYFLLNKRFETSPFGLLYTLFNQTDAATTFSNCSWYHMFLISYVIVLTSTINVAGSLMLTEFIYT